MAQSSCIQLLSTKAQVISLNARVDFDKVCIQVDTAILYDESKREITITKKGLYQVNWWLSSSTARHVEQIIFSVGINKNGETSYLHANTANTTSGEVSGTGIIEVKDGDFPVTIWLENRSTLICSAFEECGDVYLAEAVVDASISIIQFSSDNTEESQAPLVLAKQVLNENVTLAYEDRIPFTKSGTELLPEDKGITVDENGEITVTKGTYLAIWNVSIMPLFRINPDEQGNITYQVSLCSTGLEKKKLAITGIKTIAYANTDYWPQISSLLSGSTIFRVEEVNSVIGLENSSWLNTWESIPAITIDEGTNLEMISTFEKMGESYGDVEVSESSLTIIKIS